MITTKLYNGSIELCFNEKNHRFTANGIPVFPSVTGATGIIDKSGPLMGWAVKLSKEYLMENLKTLMADTKGDKIAALIEDAAKQHYIKKEAAADIGTQVHDWVEAFIKAKSKKDWPAIPKDTQVYN